MSNKPGTRRGGHDPGDPVSQMLAEGDLEGLAEFLNEQAGTRVVDVDSQGIRSVSGGVTTDLDEFRRRVREDPAGALDLVRGPPLAEVDAAWAVPVRAQIRSEIVAAAHAACRVDPANAADHLQRGLVGAPSDTSLWIALFRLAGESGSMSDLEMTYGWARDTYATSGTAYFPRALRREYRHWRRTLRTG